ncbi:hypothetical protein C8J56DRAFT_1156925 [Mycena floridula]|nr:hypothetical protein C8J56DRAFT_1156925 [Mycena floridula]
MVVMPEDAYANLHSSQFLIIPKKITPQWANFFSKLGRYTSFVCGDAPGMTWDKERRNWSARLSAMKDEGLNEFDMLFHASKMREKGNILFRNGELEKSLFTYIAAATVFPSPDILNNVAAAALATNRWSLAEVHASKALCTELMTDPSNKAKAYRRLAQAHQKQGKFDDAIANIRSALELTPNDPALKTYHDQLLRLVISLKTPAERQAYIDSQPVCPPKGSEKEDYLPWLAALGAFRQGDCCACCYFGEMTIKWRGSTLPDEIRKVQRSVSR